MPSTYVAGINAVHALFSSSRRPCTLFISEDIIESALIKNIKELAIRHRVSIVSTKRGFLDTLTTARHQGIVAVLDDFKYTSLETLFSKVFMHERFEQKAAQESAISDKDDREYQKINERERQNHSALVIFLDKITDIHNFGAIIRTAVCAGVAGIVIPASGNASVNEAVFKTSVGAVSFAEICRTDNLVVAIEKFRKRGGI
ncbi:MAG: TrmH family RNA methyltransferase, partial [Thermoplasmata archaeon]